AEDGIRDFHVTGVQTCALPISRWVSCPSGGTPPGRGVSAGCTGRCRRGGGSARADPGRRTGARRWRSGRGPATPARSPNRTGPATTSASHRRRRTPPGAAGASPSGRDGRAPPPRRSPSGPSSRPGRAAAEECREQPAARAAGGPASPDSGPVRLSRALASPVPPTVRHAGGLGRGVRAAVRTGGVALVVAVVRPVGRCRLRAGAPAQVAAGLTGLARGAGVAGEVGPDEQSESVLVGSPGVTEGVDEEQSPPVLLL